MTKPEGYEARSTQVAECIATKMMAAFRNHQQKDYTGDGIRKMIYDCIVDGNTAEDCTYMAFLWTQQAMVEGLKLATLFKGQL